MKELVFLLLTFGVPIFGWRGIAKWRRGKGSGLLVSHLWGLFSAFFLFVVLAINLGPNNKKNEESQQADSSEQSEKTVNLKGKVEPQTTVPTPSVKTELSESNPQDGYKKSVLDFRDLMSDYDRLTTASTQKVTALFKSGHSSDAVIYGTAKEAQLKLKQAMLKISQEKVPSGLPSQVQEHLEAAKEAMGMVIYYRKHTTEALMEYLDDPKPSKAAEMKEYADSVMPAQMKMTQEFLGAGELVGLQLNDIFPQDLIPSKSKKEH